MEPVLPIVDAALIKVTGVFSFSKKKISQFIDIGYQPMPLSENLPDPGSPDYESKKAEAINSTKEYYRDTYYNEFASLMFTGEAEKNPMKPFHRNQNFDVTFYLGFKKDRIVKSRCVCQELFLFNNEVGILSLTFEPETLDILCISDLTVALKSFDTPVESGNIQTVFHEFISANILAGIPLRGKNVKADDYSGSKFKIYSVINTTDPDDGSKYDRDKLVFEIATGSRIGELGSNGYNAPSQEYFDEIMGNSIKVFNNYTGLALLDSFTVIGNGDQFGKQIFFQSKDKHFYQFNTYNRIYFAIYVLNLYIRYNIFRFNAVFNDNPVKTREEFELFINDYNYSHISFNFLPNIFHQKIHAALNIDDEINHFEKRLGSLATKIQEDQDKRQATLLGLVSVLTGLSSSSDIIILIDKLRSQIGWSNRLFYTSLIFIVLTLSIPILIYLFPESAKKIKRKWNNRKIKK
jgi:hypothetical protein